MVREEQQRGGSGRKRECRQVEILERVLEFGKGDAFGQEEEEDRGRRRRIQAIRAVGSAKDYSFSRLVFL